VRQPEGEAKKLAHWKRVAILPASNAAGRIRNPGPGGADRYRPTPDQNPAAVGIGKNLDHGDRGTRRRPRSGFSDSEEQPLLRAGFVPVRSARVLRTETAALAALAAQNALAGDF
jgi:hypothetical protein